MSKQKCFPRVVGADRRVSPWLCDTFFWADQGVRPKGCCLCFRPYVAVYSFTNFIIAQRLSSA